MFAKYNVFFSYIHAHSQYIFDIKRTFVSCIFKKETMNRRFLRVANNSVLIFSPYLKCVP